MHTCTGPPQKKQPGEDTQLAQSARQCPQFSDKERVIDLIGLLRCERSQRVKREGERGLTGLGIAVGAVKEAGAIAGPRLRVVVARRRVNTAQLRHLQRRRLQGYSLS